MDIILRLIVFGYRIRLLFRLWRSVARLMLVQCSLVSFSYAEPQAYGLINASINYQNVEQEENLSEDQFDPGTIYSIDSHASRVGVKGSEPAHSLTGFFQVEFELQLDDGDQQGQSTTQRNSFIGIEHESIGSIRMGMFDTPFKLSQGLFDLFNDVVDISQLFYGENREANQINLSTQRMAGLQLSISSILPEAAGVSPGISTSISYQSDSAYIGLASDEKLVNSRSSKRLTGTYQFPLMRFGVLLQSVESQDTACAIDDDLDCETLAWAANISINVGHGRLNAQYEISDQIAKGAKVVSLGFDYPLNAAAKVYFILSQYQDDLEDSQVDRGGVGLSYRF